MKSNILKSLALFSERAHGLHSLAFGPLVGRDFNGSEVALDAFFKTLIDAGPDGNKNTQEQYAEAWDALRMGDNKPMLALCEVRKVVINNYIRAQSNWAEFFFDTVTLGDADSAEFVNETNQEVSIGYLSQDGKPRLQRAIAPQQHTLIPLRYVSSEKVGYQIEDIQRGNIAKAAQKTIDISFDVNNKLDKNCRALMDAALGSGGLYGTFVTTGDLHKRTYHAHSDIKTGNLPTTNDLDTPDQGESTKIILNTFREVIKYCDNWGNVFPDGALRPTGLVIVPSKHTGDLLDLISATDAKKSDLAEGLLTNYTRFHFAGVNWTILPDATLDGNFVYPILSKKPGVQFRKPSQEREFVKTELEANWEDRSFRATQGLYIPVQKRVNAVRVQFKTG